jgi:hypothetical protein
MVFGDEPLTKPGLERQISDYFPLENPRAIYEYDFGDGWEHVKLLEKILPRDKGEYFPYA